MLEKGWDINVIIKYTLYFYYFFGVFWPAPQEPKNPNSRSFIGLG